MDEESTEEQKLRMMAAIGLFGLMLIGFWLLPSIFGKSEEEKERETSGTRFNRFMI